jgi:hypothetical protein
MQVDTFLKELKNGDESDDLAPLPEAEVLVGRWKAEYNMVRPHSPLNYRSSKFSIVFQ